MTTTIVDAYASTEKRARETAARGEPVVGYVGTDVPVELIDAVGALAYRLGTSPTAVVDEAEQLLGTAVDFPALSILSQVLTGDLDHLQGVVVSRDCQASLRLFYVLRQLQLDGRHVPRVHLVDLLHLPREATARYNHSQVSTAASVLSEWTGSATSTADVRQAIRDRREVRRLLLDVQSRRRAPEPGVSGVDALRLHAIAMRTRPEAAVDMLTSFEVSATSSTSGARVFVTGSAQDHDAHYVALESAGLHVVGEDHSWGDLTLGIDVSTDSATDLPGLYDALARARQIGCPAAQTSGLRERAEYTAREVAASRAGAVLSLVRTNDVAPDWDYPMLDGVPVTRLRGARHSWSREELIAAVSSFGTNRVEEPVS